MNRRAVLAAPACLLVPGVLDAQEARLGELRWTGTHPSFPAFRGSQVGEFRGDVEVRIAMRADPNRHRAYVAFYRLAAALGSTLVPVTRVYAFRLPSLLAALAKDSAGFALLKDEMVVRNDGTVMALVTELVTGREIDVVNGPEVKVWRGWAEARAATRERALALGGFVYRDLDARLPRRQRAANAPRFSIQKGPRSGSSRTAVPSPSAPTRR